MLPIWLLGLMGPRAIDAQPVTLEPVAVSAPRVGLPNATVSTGQLFVRFDQPAIRRAVGEGRLRSATLDVSVDVSGSVERVLRFVAPLGAPPVAPLTAMATPVAHRLDVTDEVQAFLGGHAPNYGWQLRASWPGTDPPPIVVALVLDVEPPAATRGVIRVAADRWNFTWSGTREPFVPRGVNYFGPYGDGQLEDVWDDRWDLVESDLSSIAAEGLNAVRVHLQFARFMLEPLRADEHQLLKLDQLVGLARRLGLVLDVTGLAHYRSTDIPVWFSALDDEQMIDAEAAFWAAVASRNVREPAIFCYDLQNEPLISLQDRPGQVVGKIVEDRRWAYTNFHFQHGSRYWSKWVAQNVPSEATILAEQWGTRALTGRPEFWEFVDQLAARWTRQMTGAIRANDPDHLVTVGLVPWSLPFHSTLYSGFAPHALSDIVDFIAVHVYPGHPEITPDEARLTVRAAYVGLPVVLEETEAYLPTADEQLMYYRWTLTSASGWFAFYVPALWHEATTHDVESREHLQELHRTFLRFATTEIPTTGVRRRPADANIDVQIAKIRSILTGDSTRRDVLSRFHELDLAGQAVDVRVR